MKEEPGSDLAPLCLLRVFSCVLLVWITPLAPLFNLRINPLQKKHIMVSSNKFVPRQECFWYCSAHWKLGSGCYRLGKILFDAQSTKKEQEPSDQPKWDGPLSCTVVLRFWEPFGSMGRREYLFSLVSFFFFLSEFFIF